jgi:uncharacterized metal-binding protein
MKPNFNANLVFVCGGAADVGELTDRAARQLARQGIASMSCLASVAARDADIMFNADLAQKVLLIDGCPKACAEKAFELAGLKKTLHLELSQIGMMKGSSPATPESIQAVVARAVELLNSKSPGVASRA